MVTSGRQNPALPHVLVMTLSHTVIKAYSTSSFLCSTKYENCLIPNPVHNNWDENHGWCSSIGHERVLNTHRDISRRCPWLHAGDTHRSRQGYSKCHRNVYPWQATVPTILSEGYDRLTDWLTVWKDERLTGTLTLRLPASPCLPVPRCVSICLSGPLAH